MSMHNFKKRLHRFIPPVLFEIYSDFRKRNIQEEYGWYGNYESWEKALMVCSGYDSPVIVEKVKDALIKVRNRDALFERDSVLFYQEEYQWTIITWLLKVALEQKNRLIILDYGGSLGSTYFQNKRFFSAIEKLQWNIVEQSQFVETGKLVFEDEHLKFFYSIKECFDFTQPNVLFLSGVLQYLKDPFTFLEEVTEMGFEYIFIDRTAFITSNEHFISVQKVPPEIYTASYPCWFFNEEKLFRICQRNYTQECSFNALDKSNLPGTYFKGFIFKHI